MSLSEAWTKMYSTHSPKRGDMRESQQVCYALSPIKDSRVCSLWLKRLCLHLVTSLWAATSWWALWLKFCPKIRPKLARQCLQQWKLMISSSTNTANNRLQRPQSFRAPWLQLDSSNPFKSNQFEYLRWTCAVTICHSRLNFPVKLLSKDAFGWWMATNPLSMWIYRLSADFPVGDRQLLC